MRDPACEHICCEGYGPGGVAVIVTCERGSSPPPVEQVRAAFRERGGRSGALGSVGYLFRPVGLLRYAANAKLAVRAEEAGAEDVLPGAAGAVDLLTAPDERDVIEETLRRLGHECVARGFGWRAMQNVAPPPGERTRLEELVRRLAAIEGVGHVYTNAQTTDQLLAKV
jgi:transcriptional/translational regulatory protein YebC/TACO1